MLTRSAAAGLMGIVPERFSASVALIPDSGSTVTVECWGCWWKPLKSSATTHSGIQITGQESLLNVPDTSLNPAANGRVIKPRDEITVDSVVYVVAMAALKSVRTRWECLVHKKLS